MWFDESCMTAEGNPALLEGTTATEILRAVPYVRGCQTTPKPLRWTMIGTGIVHELVEKHIDQVDSNVSIEDQWNRWEEILRNEHAEEVLAPKIEGYVAYVQKMQFAWFQCPNCEERI
jgi:hypothetical protein